MPNNSMLHKVGLHPLTAFAMILVDWMLFGSDVTGIGWGISCLIAMALVVPCVLIQRFAYKDDWGLALAKGMIVGIITAIPTPLPAILTAAGGVAGALGSPRNAIADNERKP